MQRAVAVYLAGSDMNQRNLTASNKAAEQVFVCIKKIARTVGEESSPNDSAATLFSGKRKSVPQEMWSVTVDGGRVIQYGFKTNTNDSPTKRLIDLKKLNQRLYTPPPEYEKIGIYKTCELPGKTVKEKSSMNTMAGNEGKREKRGRSKDSCTDRTDWGKIITQMEAKFVKDFQQEIVASQRGKTNATRSGCVSRSAKKETSKPILKDKSKSSPKKMTRPINRTKLQYYNMLDINGS